MAVVQDVRDHGAVGDGATDNTAALQRAIDAAAAAGGGEVVVPAGRFLSRPLELASNITLHLAPGAVLKGSERLADYPIDTETVSGESKRAGLITARRAENVAIEGRGELDGSALAFLDVDAVCKTFEPEAARYARNGARLVEPGYAAPDGPYPSFERPGNIVRFDRCRNARISGVTVRDSSTWTIRIDGCEDVAVIGATIHGRGSGRRTPNDDGIDLVNSRRIRIADCDIETGDDCIALFASQQLTVTNCTLSSRSAAIRVGWREGETRDCVFSNLVIWDSNRGILVTTRGSGSVENVSFSNIVINTRLFQGAWWGWGEPIHLSAVPSEPGPVGMGRIRNVSFSNIRAESDSGIVVYGSEPSPIEDVSFNDVAIRLRNGPLQAVAGGNIDLRDAADPAEALFAHDVAGLYARHVDGLAIDGFRVRWDAGLPAFHTHGLAVERFRDLRVSGFDGRQQGARGAAISLRDGDGASLADSRAAQGTDVFLEAVAVGGHRRFAGNDLARAATAVGGDGSFAEAGA